MGRGPCRVELLKSKVTGDNNIIRNFVMFFFMSMNRYIVLFSIHRPIDYSGRSRNNTPFTRHLRLEVAGLGMHHHPRGTSLSLVGVIDMFSNLARGPPVPFLYVRARTAAAELVSMRDDAIFAARK